MITQGPIEEVGRLDLKWYEGNAYNNLGATSLTNGYDNTRKLQGNSTTFYDILRLWLVIRDSMV